MSSEPDCKTARCILYRDDEFLLAIHVNFRGRQHRRWGFPGGQIEWGEAPEVAAARELEEELSIYLPELIRVGPFSYKKALHMVFAAELREPIRDWDDTELFEIGWFREPEVEALHADDALHASYELDAIRALKRLLAP